MSEWWTYRLSSFLMFSPTIFWRLVERYNREMWPLHGAMLAVGAAMLWLAVARRPSGGAVIAGALALLWLWVGWAFHWLRYAAINWGAVYFAAGFAIEAVLLVVSALLAMGRARLNSPDPRIRSAGIALATFGIALYPFIAVLEGRPWSQAEMFGLMPEPTALATLGWLLAADLPLRRWLMVLPVISFLVGAATAWLLRS
jgi:hypothetical protein